MELSTLSTRQTEALRVIRDFIATNGYSPCLKDIARAMRISIHAADLHVMALAKKGAVHRSPGVARSIVVLEQVGDESKVFRSTQADS